jgi:hypothetical protein
MLSNIQTQLQNSDGSTHIKTQKIVTKDNYSTVLFKEKDTSVKNELSISTFANQLSSSAIKANEQSNNLSREELKEHAEKIIDQLAGYVSPQQQMQRDNEMPKNTDPESLIRAKEATAFINNPSHENNPFSSLSRDQLSLITYDESGSYTLNERSAAYYESYNREEAIRVNLMKQAQQEYDTTGKLTNFFQSVLDFYNQLPEIEQVQYPAGYSDDLENKISQDFNYPTNTTKSGIDEMDPINIIQTYMPK